MKQKICLHIMMGLPGSGKTTFANELQKNIGNNKFLYVDMDSLRSSYWYGKDQDIYELLRRSVANIKREHTDIIVDGLILTNEDVVNVVETVSVFAKETFVKIYRWDENRELCLKNDGGRRDLSSSGTILNAKYETIDMDYLHSELCDEGVTSIEVIPKKIVLKQGWERYFRHSTTVDKDGKIRSNKWCTGGAYGNCWNDSMSPVSAEDPVDFIALDNLLEEICPNITFLHYKRITKKCVETEHSYEADYYGGGCNYNNWACDLKKLYEVLEELGYITET